MAAFTQVQIARICTVPGLPGLDRAARAERRISHHPLARPTVTLRHEVRHLREFRALRFLSELSQATFRRQAI